MPEENVELEYRALEEYLAWRNLETHIVNGFAPPE